MRVNPKDILPSQNYLKPQTIQYIIECIESRELEKLPPSPIVRQNNEGKMIAIDGHNLIAVRLSRNENVDVHIAKNADDGLPETSESNKLRNQELREKFENVLEDRGNLEREGVNSFNDLIARYGTILQV